MRSVLTVLLLACLPALALAQGQPFMPPQLSWPYMHQKPDAFLIERSLDGGVTWPQIAEIPGQRGQKITWADTTLAPMTERLLVQYRVRAKRAGAVSEPNAPAGAMLGPPAPGECVVAQPSPKTIVTVCTLP